jgi:hypothetical protein
MNVTKPYKTIWFGYIHGPQLHKFIGFRWKLISQTPVVQYSWSGEDADSARLDGHRNNQTTQNLKDTSLSEQCGRAKEYSTSR